MSLKFYLECTGQKNIFLDGKYTLPEITKINMKVI